MGDVATRVGHFLSDIYRLYRGQRVFVVGHDAVVLMMRFAIENLNEQDLWSIEATHPVANAAITRWRPLAGRGQGLDEDALPEVVRLYDKEGRSSRNRGEMFGVSPHTILAALRKEGVEARPPGFGART